MYVNGHVYLEPGVGGMVQLEAVALALVQHLQDKMVGAEAGLQLADVGPLVGQVGEHMEAVLALGVCPTPWNSCITILSFISLQSPSLLVSMLICHEIRFKVKTIVCVDNLFLNPDIR